MNPEAIPGSYVAYEYYAESYKGEKLTEDIFPRYAKWASALVDQMTFGRLKDLPEIPDCVRDAICCAAEKRFSFVAKADRDLKSESNDGYSVSYADAGEEGSLVESIKEDIRIYLSGTGLLFRGTRKPARGRVFKYDY